MASISIPKTPSPMRNRTVRNEIPICLARGWIMNGGSKPRPPRLWVLLSRDTQNAAGAPLALRIYPFWQTLQLEGAGPRRVGVKELLRCDVIGFLRRNLLGNYRAQIDWQRFCRHASPPPESRVAPGRPPSQATEKPTTIRECSAQLGSSDR
jgi:hypothetical protein